MAEEHKASKINSMGPRRITNKFPMGKKETGKANGGRKQRTKTEKAAKHTVCE